MFLNFNSSSLKFSPIIIIYQLVFNFIFNKCYTSEILPNSVTVSQPCQPSEKNWVKFQNASLATSYINRLRSGTLIPLESPVFTVT